MGLTKQSKKATYMLSMKLMRGLEPSGDCVVFRYGTSMLVVYIIPAIRPENSP